MSCKDCWKYENCPYRLFFNMNEITGCIEFEKERKTYWVSNSISNGKVNDNEIEKDLEILEILKRKGVSVGFIQLLIKENCGGVREYNDFIGGDKSLHLTANEYKKLKEWLENDNIGNN